MLSVIALGVLAIAWSAIGADYASADITLVILAAFTVALGSRVTIQVPRFKGYISASDTFVFFVLLMYGGEFAVLLGAIEAFVTSWRICTKRVTVLFNTAAIAISLSVVMVGLAWLNPESLLPGDAGHGTNFIVGLSLIALTHFLVNTSLASVYGSLRDGNPFWETWKNKYVWSFVNYFVGSLSAGLLVKAVGVFGPGFVLATFPACFFVFLAYRMYLKNVSMSIEQAEAAERYAKILESQSHALRESEERFRSAFNYAPIGIGLLTSTGEWLKVNRALTEILGYSEEEFLRTNFQSILDPQDLGLTLVKIHELLSGRIQNCQMEQRYRHKQGHTVWASWSVSAASEAKYPNLIFQLQDITGRKSAEQKLQHEATHDALTGLPNRAFFMTRLESALRKTREISGYKVSVLFIDLDRFKYVNDSLGHLVGDELLKGISDRLRDCMRPSDIVARLGGDEFTILVEGRYEEVEVTRIADRIQKKFSVPFQLRGHEVYSSASIGILHASEKHQASEDMMRDADTAMYQAKRAGKARHATFDEEMHSAAREILQLETDLRRAVERNEIGVFYQPIFGLERNTIEGVEALARWEHSSLGMIPPAKFIPLAEEIGLIDKLCEHVLRRACTEIGSLKDQRGGRKQLSLSVNLSCRQFGQSALVQSICGILDETGYNAENLKVEITESVFFEHADRAITMLCKLRDLGVDINIDDFGTGYSNLSYLAKLPISTLKIDRSFVSMVDAEGGNDEIVTAIVNLARSLGLKLIAEGIETESQLAKLRSLKCEAGQGYYFSPPVTFADLQSVLGHESLELPIPRPFGDVPTIATLQ
jgi:diguanylate cyclase (GGDEF)-like protein/PAS domain S-box-containing protein